MITIFNLFPLFGLVAGATLGMLLGVDHLGAMFGMGGWATSSVLSRASS